MQGNRRFSLLQHVGLHINEIRHDLTDLIRGCHTDESIACNHQSILQPELAKPTARLVHHGPTNAVALA